MKIDHREQGRPLPDLSIIIPVFNEQDSLRDLVQAIDAQCTRSALSYELLLIDDGSIDNSRQIIRQLLPDYPAALLVGFRKNFGKSAALSAGFNLARADRILTMDADLQDDPAEIPRFIEKMNQGYCVVSGWKKRRHDPLSKLVPSRIFNFVLRKVFSLRLHDFNCGFKAYCREAVSKLQIYGELHRFTPVLLGNSGFRVAELVVTHFPRRFGRSKFGTSRLIKGLLDLFTVLLITRYRTRPLHLIGLPGLALFGIGFLICLYLSFLWFVDVEPIGDRPLLLLGILCLFSGIQLIGVGLIGEMLVTLSVSEDQKYVIEVVESAHSHASDPVILP